MRGRKYSRHWLMLAYLLSSPEGRRIDEIAREVKCATQTVRRDLVRLQSAGFPIERQKSGGRVVWLLSGEFRGLPPVPFGPLEAAVLALAEKRLRKAGDEFFGDLISEMLTKVKQGRTAQVSRVVKRLEESFVGLGGTDEPDDDAKRRWPEEIVRAIRGRLKLEVDFRDGRRFWRRQRIAPIRLWIAEEKTLVQAFCYARRTIRTLELSNFRRLRVTREKFTPEWKFDPEGSVRRMRAAFKARPERVDLEFDGALEHELRERPLHASQELARRDGLLAATLTVPVGEGLVHELMRFGGRVRVVRPARLARLLVSRHRAAVAAIEERSRREEEEAIALPLVFD